MKLCFALVVCALVIIGNSGALPRSGDAEIESIRAAEHAWAQAPVKGDADAMAGFMPDDYVEIVMEPASGASKNRWVTSNKKEWIDLVRSGREKYASVELRNIKVYLHGDIATVTGEYSQTGTKDGKDISASGLYVDTWVKKDGKWRVVSSVFP
jgi:ketosteroid isomerase-like protein